MTLDLRELERESLVMYLSEQAEHLQGEVLDYGCGDQRYREIVRAAGGNYHGYDRKAFPANTSQRDIGDEEDLLARHWDVILCTQIVQYVPDVLALLVACRKALRYGGVLVITWPTNWPEVEPEDLHRFTQAGMRRLLFKAGFRKVESARRASFTGANAEFALGYGAVCWT